MADALATKLLQRFNHSVSAMRTTSQHLSQGIILVQIKIEMALTLDGNYPLILYVEHIFSSWFAGGARGA